MGDPREDDDHEDEDDEDDEELEARARSSSVLRASVRASLAACVVPLLSSFSSSRFASQPASNYSRPAVESGAIISFKFRFAEDASSSLPLTRTT